MSIELNSSAWRMRRARTGGRASRRTAVPTAFPENLLTADTTVAEAFEVEPVPRRAVAGETDVLDISYIATMGEGAVLALRHPSGALTFHVPVESSRRAGGSGSLARLRFQAPVRLSASGSGRRGLMSSVLKGFIIRVASKVMGGLVSAALPRLAAAYERAAWKRQHRTEGWHLVSRDTLAVGSLKQGVPSSTDRSLLFLHGTFSNAVSAFKNLAATDFFDRVESIYGQRVFAFNHFTVSKTPEENARMLLEALPDQEFNFDVITHSRGGLVLRNLVERRAQLGKAARRFNLGRAILVAAPNAGTPLASGTRWQETVGWLANLVELFPDNPLTGVAGFVANAIVWIAKRASGDLPGLQSMDPDGSMIADLQSPPGPPLNAYSALVANYHPTESVLARMLDVGVDQFFSTANDLVVPTEGGWQIDAADSHGIPASRIGCFGPGGNLHSDSVTHLNLFSQTQTIEFLVKALGGISQGLDPVDLSRPLPDRRFVRSVLDAPEALRAVEGRVPGVAPIDAPKADWVKVDGKALNTSDTFHLMILPDLGNKGGHAQIVATYGSARVLERFFLRGKDDKAGKRWHAIIQNHMRIRKYVDSGAGSMPEDDELQRFGEVLFRTLFPGGVGRLYDTARSLQRNRKLALVFTSLIPWIAEKPWEFAFDPVRRTYLATEELLFVRNVMTAIPAEIIEDQSGKLNILIASAQPLHSGRLSIEAEDIVIRRAFETLREAGLAEIDVLPRATPASLHAYIASGRYSVVHFIGHGEYDAAKETGYLLFQDDDGRPYKVDQRSIREILCQRGIRMVFLNACESGQGGHTDFNSGVAPALVAGGMPIVVANQYKVLDASATFFAQQLYWSLAQGTSIGEAVREARIAVNYSIDGESMDWAVPVVYARDPNSRLCEPRAVRPRTAASQAARSSSRRAKSASGKRFCVWDVSAQFPRLSAALARINQVQTLYGFEIANLSVPLNSWHIDGEGRFLHANHLADRLAPQIAHLKVDGLCAIVDEPLMYETDAEYVYNIYGWWPDKDKPSVYILSTSGLDLDPESPSTDRALGNLAVTAIAGELLDKSSHSRGPRDCPLFYNPDRDVNLITGKQRFCKGCLGALREYPKERDALNAILAAFP